MSETLHLTVKMPFGDYARGDRITDPETVAAVLESHPHHVVKHAPVEE
jgi:hypothetical protein